MKRDLGKFLHRCLEDILKKLDSSKFIVLAIYFSSKTRSTDGNNFSEEGKHKTAN